MKFVSIPEVELVAYSKDKGEILRYKDGHFDIWGDTYADITNIPIEVLNDYTFILGVLPQDEEDYLTELDAHICVECNMVKDHGRNLFIADGSWVCYDCIK